MTWRNCEASGVLLEEVNARWPGRDTASDGTIGDAAHATRTSDHNPWISVDGQGVVRARDIDVDGVAMAWLVEHLRQLGAKGDRRLTGGGYLIFNERITCPDFSGWRRYTGVNPHTHHAHVSFSRDVDGFDSTAPWGIRPAAAAPPSPAGRPTLRRGSTGPDVELLQRWLGVVAPGQSGYGTFGPATEAAVRRYQNMRGLLVDGVVGPKTWQAMGL